MVSQQLARPMEKFKSNHRHDPAVSPSQLIETTLQPAIDYPEHHPGFQDRPVYRDGRLVYRSLMATDTFYTRMAHIWYQDDGRIRFEDTVRNLEGYLKFYELIIFDSQGQEISGQAFRVRQRFYRPKPGSRQRRRTPALNYKNSFWPPGKGYPIGDRNLEIVVSRYYLFQSDPGLLPRPTEK